MGSHSSRRPAQPHWTLLAILLVVLLLVLVLSGLTSGQIGEGAHAPRSATGPGRVPSAILGGGAIGLPSMRT